MDVKTEPVMRSIGAQVPEQLYWQFVQARVDRHESATKALETAILLYLEICPTEEKKEDS